MGGLTTSGLADLMGVKTQTIRNWIKAGKIPHHTAPSGRAYFTEHDIKTITSGQTTQTITAFYARSSCGSKTAINNQLKTLETAYGEPAYKIRDTNSGLNEHRKGLAKLMKMAHDGEINNIAITTQDRLTRFGYKYIERYLNHLGVTIHYISKGREQNEYEELMSDFMALIASFTGRFYHIRGIKQKHQLLEAARKRIDEGHSVEEREANKLG